MVEGAEIALADATSIASAVARGDASAVEVTQASLDRIDRREPEVSAWAHLDRGLAIELAKRVDHGRGTRSRRFLAGVPVGVKDLIDTAGLPTEYGSERYRGHLPNVDAACVKSLRRAGAVLIGKTVTTELALWSPPPTRNPHAAGRTPGGSSAGSAAAVADRMVPVTIGTQTAGSIIRPASYCGVLGFVPTAGRWDRVGVKPLSPSLDRVGIFANSTDDLRVVADALDHPRSRPVESHSKQCSPRIGLAQDVAEAAPQLRRVLGQIGDVRWIDVWHLLSKGALLHDAVMRRELRTTLHAEIADPRRLTDTTRSYLETLRFDEHELDTEQLERGIASCRDGVSAIFTECDIIIASSVAGEAPLAVKGTGDPWFCRLWSLLGLPSLSLPICSGPNGLPVGLQIVGSAGGDEIVLDVADLLGDVVRGVGALEWVR